MFMLDRNAFQSCVQVIRQRQPPPYSLPASPPDEAIQEPEEVIEENDPVIRAAKKMAEAADVPTAVAVVVARRLSQHNVLVPIAEKEDTKFAVS